MTGEIERLKSDLALAIAERDAAEEVSHKAIQLVAHLRERLNGERCGLTEIRTEDRNRAERLLNEATDYIAGTGEQPTDPRAWSYLLIYCPKDVLADFYQARMIRRIDEIRRGEP